MDSTVAKHLLVGAAGGAALTLLISKLLKRVQAGSDSSAALSTTSSGHSGAVYETDKAVAEYLLFHFAAPKDILPYQTGPHDALEFASRTASLCVTWCEKAGVPLTAAFDVGCAVGRTSFDLSKRFAHVTGLDFSHAFIATANKLKTQRSVTVKTTVEGQIEADVTVTMPEGVQPDRITFLQGDACNLPTTEALQGPFSVIHGANLLCRLPNPHDFLRRLPELLVSNGLVIFISPYSWLSQYTPQANWLGGYYAAADGKQEAVRSFDGLRAAMERLGFKLLHTEECPFLIREHVRKYQWGCSQVTVWQKSA